MEYKQSDQDKRLSGIEEAQKGKKEHNTRILIALIGAVSTLGAAAFGLAQFFFQEVKTIAHPKNNKTAGIVRLVVLLILLINQTLISFGYNPLPFSEEQIYEGVSSVALVVSAIWTWWKNNSVTKEAEEADQYLRELKGHK